MKELVEEFPGEILIGNFKGIFGGTTRGIPRGNTREIPGRIPRRITEGASR